MLQKSFRALLRSTAHHRTLVHRYKLHTCHYTRDLFHVDNKYNTQDQRSEIHVMYNTWLNSEKELNIKSREQQFIDVLAASVKVRHFPLIEYMMEINPRWFVNHERQAALLFDTTFTKDLYMEDPSRYPLTSTTIQTLNSICYGDPLAGLKAAQVNDLPQPELKNLSKIVRQAMGEEGRSKEDL